MIDIHADRILILDFGSQYTQLIARRVREIGVYCEIRGWDVDPAEIRRFAPKGLILSGGPESVYEANGPSAPREAFELRVPVLGICYGMQTMAAQLGGQVESASHREFGYAQVRPVAGSRLLDGLEDARDASGARLLDVWMSHGDRVAALPPGFHAIASTDSAPFAAMADESRGWYGLQFHPEVTHTLQGGEILRRFVREIAGCEARWSTPSIIEDSIARIRAEVGADRVLLGLSGGVDSSVLAALLHRAIGQQLTAVFVDHGLLRLGEGDQVMATFAEHMGIDVVRVDAEERFFAALAGESDPETKRKIIGREFITVFEAEAERIAAQAGRIDWLVQGTLYPDVIESSSVRGPSQTIKSHHNVGGLPERMKMKLIEPLRDLFKDEVRRIGRDLGMPEEILGRQPFPGPGLAVRIVGEVTPERVAILQNADEIVVGEIKAAGLYSQIWQSFAVLLPVRSVGVMGDQRTYAYTCAIRAVHSEDGMTADWTPLPHELLKRISNRIVNEVRGINRVVYDITSKPPGTIEWE